MSAVAELFGRPSVRVGIDWARTVADQRCPFLGRTCYKVRKSEPEVSIGTPAPAGKSFGMNWKHTAKTTLVQLHHKVETFEHIDRKLVLVLQDLLMEYMRREFDFQHLTSPAALDDAMHFHPYVMTRNGNGGYRLSRGSRFSTDATGIERCLDLRADTRIELPEISSELRMRIGPSTRLDLE